MECNLGAIANSLKSLDQMIDLTVWYLTFAATLLVYVVITGHGRSAL